MALRKATDADWWRAFGHRVAPPAYWTGLAVDGRRTIDGLGGMYLADDGEWWGVFWRAPHAGRLPILSHRGGRIIVETARAANVPLRIIQDHRICTSERWLTRLSFTPTGEYREGWRVWTL